MMTCTGSPIEVLAYDTYRESVVPRRVQIDGTESNVEEVLDTTIEETIEGHRFRTFLIRIEGGERLRIAHDLQRHVWILLEHEPANPRRG